jgi:hypothetical protein
VIGILTNSTSANDWLNALLTHCLTNQLIDWLTDWLTNQPTNQPINQPTDWLTNWLTVWLAGWLIDWLTDSIEHVTFQKLTGQQVGKKFPAFQGTQKVITVFTVGYTICFYSGPNDSSPYLLPPILSSPDLILPFLCLGLPTKTLPAHYTVFNHSYNICWALNIKSSSLYTSKESCYFFLLRSKHLLQYLFFEHPQLMLLPECEEPKFHTSHLHHITAKILFLNLQHWQLKELIYSEFNKD